MVKHTQTIFRLLPKNVLNVFDHFWGLAISPMLTHFTLISILPENVRKPEVKNRNAGTT